MPGYVGGRPYSPNPVPFEEADLPRYLQNEFTRIAEILSDLGKIAWGGAYEDGACYDKGTQVTDQQWTMIANKDTCDRPAPQPSGTAAWILPDAPGWSSETAAAATLYTGARYRIPGAMFINSVRVWIPVADENHFYKVLMVRDPESATPKVSQIDWFNATSTGWLIPAIASIPIGEGVTFDLILATQNRTGEVINSADYTYSTPGNATVPGPGEITHDNQNTGRLRIHKTDDNGGDQSAMLLALKPGDRIVGAGQDWAITDTTDQGAFIDFNVTPAVQGADGVASFTFTNYSLQPAPYVEIADRYATGNIKGLFDDGTVITAYDLNETPDAYGVDVNWQPAAVSPDWDLVSAP